MAQNLALDHVTSMESSITRDTNNGYPFGVLNQDTGETFSDMEEAIDNTDPDSRDALTEASAMDWLSDVLDIHYTVNGDRSYRSARVCIGYGGPNVWIDTRTGELEVHWGFNSETRELPRTFIEGLDDALEELWDMSA